MIGGNTLTISRETSNLLLCELGEYETRECMTTAAAHMARGGIVGRRLKAYFDMATVGGNPEDRDIRYGTRCELGVVIMLEDMVFELQEKWSVQRKQSFMGGTRPQVWR